MTPPSRPPAGSGWLDRLVDLLGVLAGVGLCALTVLICLDVGARNSRLFQMPWTLDVVEYLLYGITYLGAPWVLREGGHVTIDLVVQRLGPAGRRRALRAAGAMGAAVCAVLLYYSGRVWWASFTQGTLVYETFVFPEWILLTPAPPTFLILLVVFLRGLPAPPATSPRRPGAEGG